MKKIKKSLGFSLVEVVVSVGIFAVAIVGIIGLFAPTTKNVAAVADSDGSTRAVLAIQSYFKEQASTSAGFAALQTALGADSNTTGTGYVYYSSKGGDNVGVADDSASASTPGKLIKADRFFEFTIVRNATLSPVADKDTAGFLAFTISLRWPAYLPNGVQVTDDSQKSTLIIPAAVTR